MLNSCLGQEKNENLPFNMNKSTTRYSSPPPPTVSANGSDQSDEDNLSADVENASQTIRNELTQSLTTFSNSSCLKKSQSLKLTHHDKDDSCSKKVVRFADDFGLELDQVKMIKTDELPSVPNAAFKHLSINNNDQNSFSKFNHERTNTITFMAAQFENPIYTPGFNERVSRYKVVLEQASMFIPLLLPPFLKLFNFTDAINNRIFGTIKLVSFDFHKRVKVRLTTDNWISFKDYDATYINNSYDGICDRFTFTIEIDPCQIYDGNNIQFCICYKSFFCSEYWDNNYHENYRFDCLSRTISQ